ncbi:cation-transporting P-type ATPase [Verrucosispora sp. WMMA2121]|uniref:cation-translocating P-type ATPase n=1 Tax=Verrucosispora sp. WMMA2121 TaxID=3015164 RepID=UPI0022B67BC1|nr:cation-transporting P-type ATPase [Verrucosispora sp. WMMA2121]MCZ7417963.1 cation-transporting P-type ATPase [Verrucosispora sp. WMMA2121]MCZ7418000.1 cation-transporting P-type ATPase [Verrucosispora sp. WMMA2121]MCZ7419593.1 cation-transporting P-type ATPase [Verrucosispora sp. WMMA2121]
MTGQVQVADGGVRGESIVVTAPATGLSSTEAARRLQADGPNAAATPPRRHLATRVLHQLSDPLVALLLAAAVVTTVLRDYPDTVVILLVVAVNTAIGVVQEVRADRAIAALDQLAAPTARVVRDGRDAVLPATELVRGDLVRVEAGDVVPADLLLHDASRLHLDESALTGESVPVSRAAGEEASAGTVVTTGRAVGTVVRTGATSALGRIATLAASTRPTATPLQRRLASLGRILGVVAVVLSGLVFAVGVFSGRPLVDMAVTAVSLVVAAVPESLPAVVTLALALGARRMAAARAIPRRLHAVETLGSVTVIASDKTGTLTEGRMAVQSAVTGDGAVFGVTGSGYAPHGTVHRDGAPVAVPDELRRLARAGLLCNDATLAPPTEQRPRWGAVGDPLEAALVAFAARCGLDPQTIRNAWPRVAEHPFDQQLRRMTTVHRSCDRRYLVVCKGAPENVLTAPLLDADADELAALTAAAHRLAGAGLRVLALAAAVLDTAPADPARPEGLRPLGLVAVGDPLRAAAPDIADGFADAGVRLVLVTGDHPATAAAIAGQLGLWSEGDPVVRGDDGDPAAAPPATRVYARTQPEQKLDIIAGLQSRGHVVAMTGDGVNDAPALRRADIGVAMGGGTEVARQAADLVLVDDDLSTVTAAIGEGRRIYDNIRRFLRYALSGGVAEIAVMLLGPLFGLPVPLLPAQILWINLLTHGVPGVALGAEPAEPGSLRRVPRSPQESVLGAGLGRQILVGGALIAAVTLGAGVLAAHWDRPWQSVIFIVLGLAQLGVALAVRAPRPAGQRRGNLALPLAVAASALLQVAGVLLPPLRELLGTEVLGGTELLACAAVSVLPGLALRLTRRTAATDLSTLTPSVREADSGVEKEM